MTLLMNLSSLTLCISVISVRDQDATSCVTLLFDPKRYNTQLCTCSKCKCHCQLTKSTNNLENLICF